MHIRKTQCERIVAYLQEFGSITQLEAIRDLGVMRLASRISELQSKRGYKIVGEFVKVKNRYGEACSIKCYKFASDKLEAAQ